jgi:hypothetical protein
LRIEKLMPEFIAAKSTLPACLREEGLSRGWSEAECGALIAALPPQLAACECFLDKLTSLWRYEFGEPHQVGGSLVWGIHMWPPVRVLFDVLDCALRRLTGGKRAAYFGVLVDLHKHQEFLAEMFPILRVDSAVPADHEVAGLGVGNRTLDWAIGPAEHRRILLDVKRRLSDFISQMATDGKLPPEHDVGLLFRSVEGKFLAADPQSTLQGVWIVTDIKQDEAELQAAFDALDPTKVHFAILGDAQNDVCLLTRRPQDREFLLRLFGVAEGSRFTFSRSSDRNSI